MNWVLGHAEKALETARRALAINDLREDAHRLIVQALAAMGRKAEALKHYQDLVELLKRELNTDPDAATRSVVAELRSTQPPSRSTTAELIANSALPEPDRPSTVMPPAKISRDLEEEVDAENSQVSAVPVQPGGAERRQLTIMVCNTVSSVLPSARIDAEDMHDLVAAFHKTAADVVAPFGGFVAQYLSDGVVVYFGHPVADEHDAEQAVRAGFAILDMVGTLNVASDLTLQARAGIASGVVVVSEQVGTGGTRQFVAIGEAPSEAARLQAAASHGEIVIAAGTRRLVGRMFNYELLPAIETNGQPLEAWRVRGAATGVSRFEARSVGALSPLVGRHEEIDLLLRRWDQANLREGQVVLLSGEPGIGKSRLAAALCGTPRQRAAHALALFLLAAAHRQRVLSDHRPDGAGRRTGA